MNHSDAEMDALERWAVAEEQLSVFRHDLRNRIASIRNANFYLNKRAQKSDLWGADPRVPSFFKLVDEQLVASETLIATQGSLLERMPRPFGDTSLDACVLRALEEVNTPPSVTVVKELCAPTQRAWCEAEVALLLRCLVRNAVEAVAESGGSVLLRTLETERPTFIVQDTGPGIPSTEHGRAFSPFTSTKPGHEGVGLNVARRITQRYTGHLALEAGAEKGLRVTVSLVGPQAASEKGGIH